MSYQTGPHPPQALEDARATTLLLGQEEAALPAMIRAAATDRRAKDFAALLMAQQSLPTRKAEAEKVQVAEELAYAEKRQEHLRAKRDEASVQLEKAADREQAARQEVAMAQGERENATYEIGQLMGRIKSLKFQADRLGVTPPATLEEVMA